MKQKFHSDVTVSSLDASHTALVPHIITFMLMEISRAALAISSTKALTVDCLNGYFSVHCILLFCSVPLNICIKDKHDCRIRY